MYDAADLEDDLLDWAPALAHAAREDAPRFRRADLAARLRRFLAEAGAEGDAEFAGLPRGFTGEAPPDALGRVYWYENGRRVTKPDAATRERLSDLGRQQGHAVTADPARARPTVDAVAARVEAMRKGGVTPEGLAALAEDMGRMRVVDLRELNRRVGTRATAPRKADFVRRIKERALGQRPSLEGALAGGGFVTVAQLAKATGMSGNAVADALAGLRDAGRLEFGKAAGGPGYRLKPAAPVAPPMTPAPSTPAPRAPAAGSEADLPARSRRSLEQWRDASRPLAERVARLADLDTQVFDPLYNAGHLTEENGFPGNNEVLRGLDGAVKEYDRYGGSAEAQAMLLRRADSVAALIPEYAAGLRGLADNGVSVPDPVTGADIGPAQLRAYADAYEREGAAGVAAVRAEVEARRRGKS